MAVDTWDIVFNAKHREYTIATVYGKKNLVLHGL